MKGVDFSSDFLLSCCCLLLPMMSSNGIQLMMGRGSVYMGGKDGIVIVLRVHVCTPMLTHY